jgi:type I restriction enzyme S subunit
VDAPKLSDVFVLNTQKHITEAALASCAASLLPIGVTIVTARGTVGKLAMTGNPMAINQSCYALSGKAPLEQYSTYFLIYDAVRALQSNTHGSVFDTITRETFKSVTAVIPPSKCVRGFECVVTPMMERILTNRRESATLIQARDFLLPKLMSGEVRVKDAEKIVETVL